jgi:hypothetical protein
MGGDKAANQQQHHRRRAEDGLTGRVRLQKGHSYI